MDIIRKWIITIVSVIIFVTVVEMLIPNSNNKRYINVVIGLLVMIVILNPILYLIKDKNINFEQTVLENFNQMEYLAITNRVNQQELRNDTVVELYTKELTKQIKNRIERLWEYEVDHIYLAIENDDIEHLGLIKKMEITLKQALEIQTNYPLINDIEPIEISIIANKKDNTMETNGINIGNKENIIKDDLSIFYNLPKENIELYIRYDK